MKILSRITLLLAVSNWALATTSLDSVSGASVATKSTTDSSWTIFGGMQTGKTVGDFPSCTLGSTCNTCTGTNNDGGSPRKHYPCNPNGIFPDTKLTFNGTTTVANTGGNKWLLCDGVTDRYSSTDLSTSLSVDWSTLCSDGGSSGCTALNKTMTFGASTDCNTLNGSTEKVSVKFYTRDVNLAATSDYDPSCAGTIEGACGFSLYPGDSKVYFEKEVTTINTATVSSTGATTTNVPYNKVVFFYTKQTDAEIGNDQATFERVFSDANPEIVPFSISSDGSGLEGTFIDSLENDTQKYCFKMGTQDAAGNIDHISSTDCQAANCESTLPAVCMTPSEVVGILSDKKCFIATAAYGSDMDQHVQLLRQFRNEFMAPFWIGRKLVKGYYTLSPVLARWIAQHEETRTLARWILWPLMGWAELALKFGWAVVVAPFLLFILVFLLIRNRKQGFKKA